jgi:teichuronic acid exporter
MSEKAGANTSTLKHKAFSGYLWTLFDKLGSQLIGFIITIILARLLSPKEFGLVAMATVFFSISRIFIDGGLRDSLIQKKDAGNHDYNSVFIFNLFMGVAIYTIIFFTAPLIAAFYNEPELTLIVRILGCNLLIFPFSVVQVALITKALRFKALVKLRIPATILAGLVGLTLAWYGLGVYALVAQIALETIFFNIFLWYFSTWRPSLQFNKTTFLFHWRHGLRLMLVDLMTTLYRNIFSLVIGKYFSAAQLGFYNRADTFKVFTYNNTVGVIQTVSYPILVQAQDDNTTLKKFYRKIFQATYTILFPVLGFLILFAEPLIEFLLTKKWLASAPILMVLTLGTLLSPFNSINLNVLKVKRRTDLLLKAETWNKLTLITIAVLAVNLGFDYLIYSTIPAALLSVFINSYFTNKVFHYPTKEQLQDLFPLLVSFVGSMTLTFYARLLWVGDLLPLYQLIIGGIILNGSYILIIFVIKRSLISSFLDLVRRKKKTSDGEGDAKINSDIE